MNSTRGEARTRDILEAVLELLDEVGYEHLTIDALAARMGASKMTIYRRWRDKRELVAQALASRAADHPELPADAPSLRDDLLALVKLVAVIVSAESVRGFASLVAAAQRDPVIAEAMRGGALARRRADCRDVIQRAIGRGELRDPGLAAVLFELIFGHYLVKHLIEGDAGDDHERFVDTVLLPVLLSGRP
ncbi:TetR/AcrR family transcriptional regulator [Nonomuraea typhae]|uniref:TetR/AcrR family transcriptional regulator n=1 Tax=Nonomuraea typhae TaxID=2603600 RepID=UPI0012FCEB7C|nr:TetR/AcrR family transcriptional regulator [Nonomuraea typhae]